MAVKKGRNVGKCSKCGETLEKGDIESSWYKKDGEKEPMIQDKRRKYCSWDCRKIDL